MAKPKLSTRIPNEWDYKIAKTVQRHETFRIAIHGIIDFATRNSAIPRLLMIGVFVLIISGHLTQDQVTMIIKGIIDKYAESDIKFYMYISLGANVVSLAWLSYHWLYKIPKITEHSKTLEREIDKNRISSGIAPSGLTNSEDT